MGKCKHTSGHDIVPEVHDAHYCRQCGELIFSTIIWHGPYRPEVEKPLTDDERAMGVEGPERFL
jgi:hypothetical protein